MRTLYVVQVPAVSSSTDIADGGMQSMIENVGIPVHIRIDAIEVDVHITGVGLTVDDRLAFPVDQSTAGWYNLGPRPGEQGSAVVNGALGVFHNLQSVKKGYDVVVRDAYDQERHFRVMQSEVYDAHHAPMQKIFADESGTYLNVISYAGVRDDATHTFDKRLVIYCKMCV